MNIVEMYVCLGCASFIRNQESCAFATYFKTPQYTSSFVKSISMIKIQVTLCIHKNKLHSYIVISIHIQIHFWITINPCHMYNHLHQPSISPSINFHKGTPYVPFATLSKKWSCSQLNDLFQKPNTISFM